MKIFENKYIDCMNIYKTLSFTDVSEKVGGKRYGWWGRSGRQEERVAGREARGVSYRTAATS